MKQDMIVILDLGSTENTVLAREVRALGVYSEIHPHDITAEELKKMCIRDRNMRAEKTEPIILPIVKKKRMKRLKLLIWRKSGNGRSTFRFSI